MTDEDRANDTQPVAEALDWAYRQGCTFGEKAADAFAREKAAKDA